MVLCNPKKGLKLKNYFSSEKDRHSRNDTHYMIFLLIPFGEWSWLGRAKETKWRSVAVRGGGGCESGQESNCFEAQGFPSKVTKTLGNGDGRLHYTANVLTVTESPALNG